LHDDLAEVDTIADAAKIATETAAACGRVLRPRIAVQYQDNLREASAVMIRLQASQPRESAPAARGSFDCIAWRHGAWALARASVRAAAGRDWQGSDEPERFCCTTLRLHAGTKTWLLLDGEAIALGSPVELRYLPSTVKTFAFASGRPRSGTLQPASVPAVSHKPGNHHRLSHVRI
jgi:hypothetical protein